MSSEDPSGADEADAREVTTEFPHDVDGELTAVGMAQQLRELTGAEFTPAEVLALENYGHVDFDGVVDEYRVMFNLEEVVDYLVLTGELTSEQLVAVMHWIVKDLGYPVSDIVFVPDSQADDSFDDTQVADATPGLDDMPAGKVDLAALITEARGISADLATIDFS